MGLFEDMQSKAAKVSISKKVLPLREVLCRWKSILRLRGPGGRPGHGSRAEAPATTDMLADDAEPRTLQTSGAVADSEVCDLPLQSRSSELIRQLTAELPLERSPWFLLHKVTDINLAEYVQNKPWQPSRRLGSASSKLTVR